MSGGVKYYVRRAVLIVALLCAAMALGQTTRAKLEQPAIQKAKATLISTFDSSLPRISLEYFLNYESPSDGSVDWEATPCPATPSSAKRGERTCVVATMRFRDGRVVMVALWVWNVGGYVQLRNVLITGQNGSVRKLRLIELPAAIQREWRKLPRLDLWPATTG